MNYTYLRKDLAYVYNKLAKINTTREQLIFLEHERKMAKRLYQYLAEK